MKTNEHTVRDNTLSLLHDIKANEGDLHSQDGTKDVEGSIGNVETVRVTTCVISEKKDVRMRTIKTT